MDSFIRDPRIKSNYYIFRDGKPGISLKLPGDVKGEGLLLNDQHHIIHSCKFTIPSDNDQDGTFYQEYDKIAKRCYNEIMEVFGDLYKDYTIEYLSLLDKEKEFNVKGKIIQPLAVPKRREFIDYTCIIKSIVITGFTIISEVKKIVLLIDVGEVSNIEIINQECK